MKINILPVALIFLLLLAVSNSSAEVGGGAIKIGYSYLDEDGNRAVNNSTFNDYEGFSLSLEKFRYLFNNGINLTADLKRITLNNRHLSFGLEKPGLFGIRLNNNQYRRIYKFDGSSFIRRHTTAGNIWFYPHRYIKVFGGGGFVGCSGSVTNIFNLDNSLTSTPVDYEQKRAYGGVRINHQGRMFRAEYGGIDYTNKENYYLDQSRRWIKFRGFVPVPGYEWARLTGAYLNYRTWYIHKDIEIKFNKGWGGATLELPGNFTLKYNFIFERTASDSDLVATDNIANTVYLSYIRPGQAGMTVGYQNDIKDDFENIVKANSYYFSGWYKLNSSFKFRSEFGFRAEEVDAGSRLLGEEDRNRFKISGQYRNMEYGSIELKYEVKNKNNDQLGSEADFDCMTISGDFKLAEYADLAFGYSYAVGEYTNTEQEFEFIDHLLYGDVMSREYYNIRAGGGIVYYRSRRDLDVENITLKLNGQYRFLENHFFEIKYNIHNFDDFLVTDQYYTSNIIEINLIKNLSL